MGSNHLNFGALDRETLKYTSIVDARKGISYICPCCRNDVIVKQGDVKVKHFAHKAHSSCDYYTHPSESQQHQEAKLVLKHLLENRVKIRIIKACRCEAEIVYPETFHIHDEFSFEYPPGQKKRADVAILNGKHELLYIFEVFYKHKTLECNRPDPWFEIRTTELLNRNAQNQDITLHCNRNVNCRECEIKQQEQLQEMELIKIKTQARYDAWLKQVELQRLLLEEKQLQKRNAKVARLLDEDEQAEEQWQRTLKHIADHVKFNRENGIEPSDHPEVHYGNGIEHQIGGKVIHCLTGIPNPLDSGIVLKCI